MKDAVASLDIAALCDRIEQYSRELKESQSARQAEFVVHDRTRTLAYLDRVESFVATISEPTDPLDLPKSSPSSYPIHPFMGAADMNGIENSIVRDIVRRLFAMWTEASESQSSDRATGMQSQDEARIKALIDNTRGFVQLGEEPMDLPETATTREGDTG